MLATVRVHLTYLWRHRRTLSLRQPTRFTEMVQHRKLYERDARFTRLTDKLAVKTFVRDTLGDDWVTPTLWHGTEIPEQPPAQAPFVVKSRHGCNQVRFVRDGSESWSRIRREATGWLKSEYGRWLDEWGYRGIPREVLVEPFIGDPSTLPVDYKFYVFQGVVAAIQVHLDRECSHRWHLFDRNWRPLSSAAWDTNLAPPLSLARMIEGAEALGKGFSFIRVDLYDLDGAPRFGELSFYPGSGLDPFDPPSIDRQLGQLWLASEAPAAANPRQVDVGARLNDRDHSNATIERVR